MKKIFICYYLIFLFGSKVFCQTTIWSLKPNDIIYLRETINLEGRTLEIPKDVVINFIGGAIHNGTVKFDHTTLIGDVKAYVHIHQESVINNSVLDCSWFTPNISSGTSSIDASSTINELISIIGNYSDGQYSYAPTIYLPAGIYYCHTPINISTIRKGKRIGERVISIKGEPGTYVVALGKMDYLFGRPLSESSSSFSGISVALDNISFDGNLRVTHTLNLSRVLKSSFKNIKAIGGIQTNMYMNYAFINSFENCSFYSWDVHRPTNIDVFLGPQDVNAINFVGCVFEGANLGVYCGDGYTVNFNGCVFEGLRSAAIYVYKTDQVSINGCYFEENSTTKNHKTRKDLDWKTFGIKGKKIYDGTKSVNKQFEIHSDVFLNDAALKTDCDFSDIVLTNTTEKEQSSIKSTGAVTLTGNSIQRINSCSRDNVYRYDIPNDAFVFVADGRQVTLIGNSVTSIFADEVKGEWRGIEDYQSPILLKGFIDNPTDVKNISLQNNLTSNKKDETIKKIKFK